jgi:hypothetical protein
MHREKHTEIVSNGVIGRRLLNVREAAQYLGLEVDTVHKSPGCGRSPASRSVVRCGSM